MRRILCFAGILFSGLVIPLSAMAADPAQTDALGLWMTEGEKSVVEVFMDQDLYAARIVWLKDPLLADGSPQVDAFNPDPAKASQPIIGLTIAWGFQYDGDHRWKNGKVYDPENGKTYKGKMALDGDTIKLRGYIGVPALGRTTKWTRVDAIPAPPVARNTH